MLDTHEFCVSPPGLLMFIPDIPSEQSGLELWLNDWFSKYLNDEKMADQYEVEAKLGLLLYKDTGYRIDFPVMTETIVQEGSWCIFESNVPVSVHKHFNQLLNKQITSGHLRYEHTRTTDKFFKSKGLSSKARVTVDDRNEVVCSIEKQRIADVAIFYPNAPFDIRISINREIPLKELPPLNSAFLERRKDRMSYRCQEHGIQLDLTQVRQSGEMQPRHELEIEYRDPIRLVNSYTSIHLFAKSIRNIVMSTIKG